MQDVGCRMQVKRRSEEEMKSAEVESLWTEKELAKYLNLTVRTVRFYRKSGQIPETCYCFIGKRIRYFPDRVRNFLDK